MQKIQFPAPIYIFISENEILIHSLYLTGNIAISSKQEVYETLAMFLQGIEKELPIPRPILVIQSNDKNILNQFNHDIGLHLLGEIKALINARATCKKFNFFEIEYKMNPEIPETSVVEVEVQTIKEMISQLERTANVFIAPEDLALFKCIDLFNGKQIFVTRISPEEPISKKFITKKQTIIDHPSNKLFQMDPDDQTIYCKYNLSSMEYSFPPSRIGIFAPFEHIKLLI